MKNHNASVDSDPFTVLGLSNKATELEVRQRYLQLVKLHPPERDPQNFREIHRAYEFAKDPLILARHLLKPPARLLEWDEVIEQQLRNPPPLRAALLIALGNRPDTDSAPSND